MDNVNTASSIGRRDILKKSAVVAATAWTAPMIVSSKVGASSGGTCLDEDCKFHYLVKIDAGGGCDDSFPNNPGFGAGTDQDCHVQFEHLLGSHGISEVRSGGCHNVVTVLTNTSTLLKIKLPPAFRVKFALRKQGQGCVGDCGTGDPVCDSAGAPTYTFSCGEYSNMILVVCGPDQYGAPLDAYKAFSEPSSLETQSLETDSTEIEPLETQSRSLMTEETAPTTEATTTSSTEPPPTTEATTTTTEAATTTTEAATTTSTEPPPTTEATPTTSEVATSSTEPTSTTEAIQEP